MQRYGNRFVQLGEIATIRRGITSGCDAFFMLIDKSASILQEYSDASWKDAPIYTRCRRSEVESGDVALMMCGNGTIHPIETRYLTPEIRNLMTIHRPVIRARDLKRRILYVNQPQSELKGSYIAKYLRYGETHSFPSRKSKPGPVSTRPTCLSRERWYDITHTRPGYLLWPMFQQYRHLIPINPNRYVANNNLTDVHLDGLTKAEQQCFAAVANSTLVSLWKTFYGRYAGTEGNMQMKLIDLVLVEIPDPRKATRQVRSKLTGSFERLCQRDTQPMVEEEFMACRSSKRAEKLKETPINLPAELRMGDRRDLDLSVFELIGVTDQVEREKLCDDLYVETAKYLREIRTVEIKKQEQRTKSEGRGFRIDELALDVWDALTEYERVSIPEWIKSTFAQDWTVAIPDGNPKLPDAEDMLDATTVFFSNKKGARAARLNCPTRAHAEVVYQLGKLGIRGDISLPNPAEKLRAELSQRLSSIDQRVDELARSRSTDESRIEDLAALLRHWMILGKPQNNEPGLSRSND
jgi:hypothetical protein